MNNLKVKEKLSTIKSPSLLTSDVFQMIRSKISNKRCGLYSISFIFDVLSTVNVINYISVQHEIEERFCGDYAEVTVKTFIKFLIQLSTELEELIDNETPIVFSDIFDESTFRVYDYITQIERDELVKMIKRNRMTLDEIFDVLRLIQIENNKSYTK